MHMEQANDRLDPEAVGARQKEGGVNRNVVVMGVPYCLLH